MVKRTWMSILRGMAIVGGMTAADAAFAAEGCSTPAGVDCKQPWLMPVAKAVAKVSVEHQNEHLASSETGATA